jgi:hypothetical protein
LSTLLTGRRKREVEEEEEEEEEQGGRNTCSFRSPWVTLPLNLFFPTHFVLFPSALI